MSLDAWLRGDSALGAIVLDGGLATELERKGHDISGPLWSSRVLLDAPEAIEQLHYEYLAAGAHCIISASYQASYEGFGELGLTHAQTTAILERSVALALGARKRYEAATRQALGGDSGRQRRFVAASVGPYGATLHDGSEYHGNYGLSEQELIAFHEERFGVLAHSGADVLACETIPSLDEARALVQLLSADRTARAWMSFTSPDGVSAAHGEPLAECARVLDSVENVIAVGVNCVDPRVVSTAIRQLKAGTDKPIVVYPNSGEHWDAEARQWKGETAGTKLDDCAAVWRDEGARMIGGCCRTGPADIAALRRSLEASQAIASSGAGTGVTAA